jgi:predicted PurR-regulated permease PerM
MKTVQRGMGVDMAERVAALEVAQARLVERVENIEERFEDHEKKQNGSLQRIEQKMEAIDGKLGKQMNAIYMWLIGLMGGVIASLILLLVNISLRR